MEMEKIQWKTMRPPEKTGDFPCMICGKEVAEYFRRFSINEIRVKLAVCSKCVRMTDLELTNRLSSKGMVEASRS